MDGPSKYKLVGTFYFFLSGGKTDSPEKHKNLQKNLTVFGEKFWKNIFSYFQKFSVKFSVTLAKSDG